MLQAFLDDADSWILVGGLAIIAWGFWPQWREQYRRWRRHAEWQRTPF